jgi:two-component system KDP operon response regulator KdpE
MSRRTNLTSTVLVIDGDTAMTAMLKAILEPRSFIVMTAHQVNEGIDIARLQKPDVIVLDLYMAGPDGGKVCRSIREFTQVPILVLSAMNKPGAVAQALNEGADDYLIKPVPVGVLVAHLNNLIRRAHAESIVRTAPVNPL